MTSSPANDRQAAFDDLERELVAFIEAPADPGEAVFNRLALELFAFQFKHNLPYANFCRSLGSRGLPGAISHWSQIPAVPTDAYKHFGLELCTCPGDDLAAVFRTSGTTSEQSGRRGEHGFPSLQLYHASILHNWKNLGLPQLPMRFLTPSPADAVDSSLSHMMGVLDRCYNENGDHFFIDADGAINVARLNREIAHLDSPVLLAGTALAFLHLLDGNSPALPDGSQLLETGGYKGLAIELDKRAFYEKLGQAFAVPADAIHNEYSMTELSSQFYTHGLDLPHEGPHWTRVRVIDPESRHPAVAGGTGFLEVFDLANLGTCLAVRTADLAIADDDAGPDGKHRSFKLIGRDPAALPRGCSRSADEMLGN